MKRWVGAAFCLKSRKARSGKVSWITLGAAGLLTLGFLVLTVSLVAAGWYFDWPGKWKAHSSHRLATQAMAGDDLPEALKHAHASVKHHPGSAEYRAYWKEIQSKCLKRIQLQVDDAPDPLARLMTFRSLTGMIEGSFLSEESLMELKKLEQEIELQTRDYFAGKWNDGIDTLKDFVPKISDGRGVEIFSEKNQNWAEQFSEYSQKVIALDAALADGRYAECSTGVLAFPMAWRNGAAAELAGKLNSIMDTVLQGLSAARELANRGKIFEAKDLMSGMEPFRTWLPRVPQTEIWLQNKGESLLAGQLMQAVVDKDPAKARLIFDDYTRFRESEPPFTLEQLMGKKQLEPFLQQLVEAGLRPAEGNPRTGYDDIILVSSLVSTFEDREAAHQFLGREYTLWSGTELKRGLYGRALYLASLARQFDPSAQGTDELIASAKANAQKRVEVVWKVEPTINRTRESFTHIPGWLQSVSTESDVSREPTIDKNHLEMIFRLVPVVQMFHSKIDKKQQTLTTKVKTGTRQVPNPAYQNAQNEVNLATTALNTARNNLATAQSQASQNASIQSQYGGGTGVSAMLGQVSRGLSDTSVNIAQNEVTNAQSRLNSANIKLSNTPQTFSEDVYSDYRYPKFIYEIETDLRVSLFLIGPDNSILNVYPINLKTETSTSEIKADLSKGINGVSPEFPSVEEIEKRFEPALVQSYRNVMADLNGQTFEHILAGFDGIAEEADLPDWLREDLHLCLLFDLDKPDYAIARNTALQSELWKDRFGASLTSGL